MKLRSETDVALSETHVDTIQLLNRADCLPTDDADPSTRPDIDLLFASLKQDGQKVPMLVAPDPEQPGKYRIVDGHGRAYCLGRLGRMISAIVLPTLPDEVERIVVEFATNLIRRSMSLEVVGLKACRFIELTDATQREAAERLNCSDSTISRALKSVRRIPPDMRADVNRLGPSLTGIIASLPGEAAMREALLFASGPGAEGRSPTRDQFVRWADAKWGKKKPKAKRAKRLRFRVDDRRFEIELRPGDSAETLIEACKSAVTRLTKHKELRLEAVVAALADKEPSAA
jgi:ParB/RepB/Spo0J family partition protein